MSGVLSILFVQGRKELIPAIQDDEFLQSPKVIFQGEKRVLFRGTCKKWLIKILRRKLSIAKGFRQEKLKMHGKPVFQPGSLLGIKQASWYMWESNESIRCS